MRPIAPINSISPSLRADGLALFGTVYRLVRVALHAIARNLATAAPMKLVAIFSECFYRLICIQVTLRRAPERITPRQLLALSKAARAIAALTGRVLDFSPWTSLSPDQLDALSPAPSRPAKSAVDAGHLTLDDSTNPQSEIHNPLFPAPHSAFHIPHLSQVRCCPLLRAPGSALAEVCRNLVKLLSPGPASVPASAPQSAGEADEDVRAPGKIQHQIENPQSTIYNPKSSSPHSALRAPHCKISNLESQLSELDAQISGLDDQVALIQSIIHNHQSAISPSVSPHSVSPQSASPHSALRAPHFPIAHLNAHPTP